MFGGSGVKSEGHLVPWHMALRPARLIVCSEGPMLSLAMQLFASSWLPASEEEMVGLVAGVATTAMEGC